MKNKFSAVISCLLVIILIIIGAVPILAENDTVGETKILIDGIVAYKESVSGTKNVQEWLDGELANGAGTASEWYVVALCQYAQDLDFTAYANALEAFLNENTIASATTRQRYALTLIACGRENNAFVTTSANDSIGEQGIMSWVFGLHLLNNGVKSDKYTAADVVEKLLSLRLADGGWALSGKYSDVDVTAMTIQALAPYYSVNTKIKNAIDKALDLLGTKQLEDGGYRSYGIKNPESCAQVLVALSSVGIAPAEDTRFIKNGKTLLDGMLVFRLSDGSFSHLEGDTMNSTATTQVFYSLVSLWRAQSGLSPFYVFDMDKVPLAELSDNNEPPETSKPNDSTQSTTSSEMSEPPETTSPTESETTSKSTEQSTTPSEMTGKSSETIEPKETTSPTESETTSKTTGQSTPSSKTTNESSETSIEKSEPQSRDKVSYKVWASLGVIAAMLISCLILWLCKKRHFKNYIFVLIIGALIVCIILVTNFSTTENFYQDGPTKTDIIGTVTLAIRCDTIVGKSDSKYIPSDGVILPVTKFDISDGESVFDILVEATRKYKIQMENKGSLTGAHGMVYISGINYLYEFDFGDLSGWVYHVNGVAPSVGCGDYTLSVGDVIEWLYTCDLGNDVK